MNKCETSLVYVSLIVACCLSLVSCSNHARRPVKYKGEVCDYRNNMYEDFYRSARGKDSKPPRNPNEIISVIRNKIIPALNDIQRQMLHSNTCTCHPRLRNKIRNEYRDALLKAYRNKRNRRRRIGSDSSSSSSSSESHEEKQSMAAVYEKVAAVAYSMMALNHTGYEALAGVDSTQFTISMMRVETFMQDILCSSSELIAHASPQAWEELNAAQPDSQSVSSLLEKLFPPSPHRHHRHGNAHKACELAHCFRNLLKDVQQLLVDM